MGGRPKGRTVREELRVLLDQIDPKEPECTRRQVVARRLLEAGLADTGFLLDILRWSEGSQPPPVKEDADENHGQAKGIIIPATDSRFATRTD